MIGHLAIVVSRGRCAALLRMQRKGAEKCGGAREGAVCGQIPRRQLPVPCCPFPIPHSPKTWFEPIKSMVSRGLSPERAKPQPLISGAVALPCVTEFCYNTSINPPDSV